MRRISLLVAVATVAACAPSQPSVNPSTVSRPTRIQAEPGTGESMNEFARTVEDRAIARTIAVAPAQAWPTVVAFYQEMGLGVAAVDEKAFTIRGEGRVPRRLLGASLSQWLDCGVGGATRAPLANSYEVTLEVASALQPVGTGAELQVLVRGRAKDPIHSTPALPCTSTGRLEELLARRITAPAAGS